jgi:signal transduction histidine kinase
MSRYRVSLGFQLGSWAAACVFLILLFWGGMTYVFLKSFVTYELARRTDGYGQRLASRALGSKRAEEDRRALTLFLNHLLKEPGIAYASVVNASKNSVWAKPDRNIEPSESSRSMQWPVHDARGRVTGWVQIWYSPEALLRDAWRTGRTVWLLTALISALVLGGAVYAGCWFLVFRPVRRLLEKRWGTKLYPEAPAGNELVALLRRFDQVSRRLEETEENLAVLLESSKAIASPTDIQEAFTRVLDIVWRRVDKAPCLLWREDEDGALRIKSFRNFPPKPASTLRLSPGEGNVGRCFLEKKTIVAQKLPSPDEFLTEQQVRSLEVRTAAHFPVTLAGKSAGVLTAFSKDPAFFNEERRQMIETLADTLSLAAKSAHFYAEMQDFNRRLETEVASTARELTRTNVRLIRRVRELRSLYDVVSLASKVSWEELVAKTTAHVTDLFGLRGAALYLWTETEGAFVCGDSPFTPSGKGPHAVPPESLSARRDALASGETVLLSNPEEVRRYFPGSTPLGAIVLAPLHAGGELMGFIAAAARPMASFEEEDVNILTLFSRHLSEVLSGGRYRDERERRIRDLTTLQKIALALSGEPDLSDILANAVRTTAESLGADVCAFLLYDEETGQLVVQPGAYGLSEDPESKLYKVQKDDPTSSSSRVFLSGEPFFSEDAQNDPEVNAHYARLWNIRSLLVAPLRVENRSIGVLRVGHRKPRRFTQDHLRLAMLIADRVSVIVQNARLYRQIREQLEKLERQNREKTEFISLVSHELRSPLTAIRGFVNVILGKEIGPLSEKQERFLTLTRQAVDRLTILTNDLLDMSRLEVGRVEVEPVPLAVGELLDEVRREHLAAAEQRKISLTVEAATGLPRVQADPTRIRQVVDNLVSNAFKFTPEGGHVTLFAHPDDAWVRIGVRDTGVGLPPEETERIFEKFYQVKSDTGVHRHGAGLGLAICKSLIELHGGKIWVESIPGKGSTFQFTLRPVSESDVQNERAGPAQKASSGRRV